MHHPIAPAVSAEAHKRAVSEAGNPVGAGRAFNVRRSSRNSSHPETPAEAVRPAVPHRGAMSSIGGSTIAQRYPRTVVSTTRITAYRSGVRGARSAEDGHGTSRPVGG